MIYAYDLDKYNFTMSYNSLWKPTEEYKKSEDVSSIGSSDE